MSEASSRMRREWAAGDRKRDFGLTTPADIRRYDDIVYGPDTEWNRLDVYRNRYSIGRLPVILLVHGGGWVYGCKELYQFYGMELAERGFAVVNYSYRLAPENKFPACLEDTVAVCRWMTEHAGEYELDIRNIFAVGDSAGGHILGLLCAYLTEESFRKNFSFESPNDFVLRAVGMNCGVYRVFGDDGSVVNPQDQDILKDLLGDGEWKKKRELLNVTSHVNRRFPPAYIMTCVGDFLVKQAPLLHKAYQDAGAESELHVFGSEEKPLYHVFHVTVQEEEGRKCNDEECAYFRRHMS